MYLNFNFWGRTLPGWGDKPWSKNGDKCRWGGLTTFLADGGDPPVPTPCFYFTLSLKWFLLNSEEMCFFAGELQIDANVFCFFFFCFLLFFFFFFFFLLFTFQNHWNLFRVYQNGKFLQGQSIYFTLGKKSGKVTLLPLKNIPLTPLNIHLYCIKIKVLRLSGHPSYTLVCLSMLLHPSPLLPHTLVLGFQVASSYSK